LQQGELSKRGEVERDRTWGVMGKGVFPTFGGRFQKNRGWEFKRN